MDEIQAEPIGEGFHINYAADGLYGDVERFLDSVENGMQAQTYARMEKTAQLGLREETIKCWLSEAVIPGCLEPENQAGPAS